MRRVWGIPVMTSNDILLPSATPGPGHSKIVAFVPIALALLGVAVVLLGGVSARTADTNTASVSAIDPMTTGAIVSPEARQRALQTLDN